MITIKGKEIKPEAITMWINIVGFVASLIFYLSVEGTFVKPVDISRNPLQDSLIHIDSRLIHEMERLRKGQDSLLLVLDQHEKLLFAQELQVTKVRGKIQTTIKNDWDSLPRTQREIYTEQLITKLKKQSK